LSLMIGMMPIPSGQDRKPRDFLDGQQCNKKPAAPAVQRAMLCGFRA
jgi:hypothetical protein